MEFVQNLLKRGGPVMWPLLICSVISLTVTIERIMFWWREKRRGARTDMHRILQRAEEGRQDAIAAMDRRKLDAAGRMVVAGAIERTHGAMEAMEVEAENEMGRMKLGLPVLDTIITVAPLLGILGTVVGIISSFELLGESGIEDPRTVTGGIAQALITTATGLTVAIITLIPYNYFVAKTEGEARRLEKIATQFGVASKKASGSSETAA